MSPARSTTRNRPVEYVGVLLGSAAAALIFGAGVAHADDGSAASTKGSESSASSERSTKSSTETGPERDDTDSKSASDATPTDADQPNDDDAEDDAPAPEDDASAPEDDATTLTETPSSTTKDSALENSALENSGLDDDSAPIDNRNPKDIAAQLKTEPEAPVDAPAEPVSAVVPIRKDSDAEDRSPRLVQTTSQPATSARPTTPTTLAAPPRPPDLAQLVRSLTGLSVDAAAISASLVSNVAYQVAQTLGPGFLGGGPHYTALAIAGVAADISRQITGAPLSAGAVGRYPVNYGVFNPLAWLDANAAPPGANDPNVSVTAAHPLPIILVNGTTETAAFNWSVGAPVLANAGYKVYSFGYGTSGFPLNGVGDIAQSAEELSAQIDLVLTETGASQVILVGHSQGGGILPAYYMNVLGGAGKVSQLIGIAPSNHGTDVNYLAYALALPVLGPLLSGLLSATLPALEQQSITSPFQQIVYGDGDGDGDTRPGVLYTTIVSTYDEILTPYTQQFLDGPSVTNIVIQDQFPGFQGGHLSVLVNPAVWSYVLDALSANPAANPLSASSTLVAA